MKKLVFFFIFILTFAGLAIGQVDSIPNPPDDWGDVIFNLPKWFTTFGGVVLLTAFLTAFFNGLLKVTKPFIKQLIAWGVAIILLVVTNLINFGYAADFPILLSVIHGFGAGLASNGVFDVPFIKGILAQIEGWFKPKA